MKLMDIIQPSAIIPALQGTTRDQVIEELIDKLIESGAASAQMRDELIASVLERENRGSTGFGKGVAVPHVKHPTATKPAAVIGVCQEGIDFNALDKEPVYSFILLMSPADKPDEHLKAMEVIFNSFSQPNFRRFLRQSTTQEDVVTLLEDADNQRIPN